MMLTQLWKCSEILNNQQILSNYEQTNDLLINLSMNTFKQFIIK